MVGVAIFALIGLLGIVMDLGHLYVRKTELQNAADAAALAGVKQLNGQPAGIDAAVAEAIALAGANASDFGQTAVSIAAAQISFSKVSPDGPWETAATAKADADVARYTFIKVDTNGIAQETRATWFMPLVSAASTSTANGKAVAGAPVCDGLPIFICPPAEGFKLGQSYLFADKPSVVGYFDPVPLGAPSLIPPGASEMSDIVCAGKTYCIGAGTYTSRTQSAFGKMEKAFNTRFGQYKGELKDSAERCRPDTNVRSFISGACTGDTCVQVDWMTPAPNRQSDNDPPNDPPGGEPFGVHWSAVRPAVMPGLPAVNASYPPAGSDGNGTPYSQISEPYYRAPEEPYKPYAQAGRRIVTMAIADASACDDDEIRADFQGANKAIPIASYGRFFLPRTIDAKGIYVEFIEEIPQLKASAPDIKLFR